MIIYKIGIDVSSLCGNKTGIGRYTYELVSRLVNQPYTHFILYSNIDFNESILLNRNNVTIKIYSIRYKIPRIIWGQIILPIQLFLDRVDVFWAPSHRIPIFIFGNTPVVVTIHDLVWKKYPKTMNLFSWILDFIFTPIIARSAKSIITVSVSTAKDFWSEYPASKRKVWPIVLGASDLIDGGSNILLEKLKNKSNKYVLFVGTIEPRKNLERLLEAFSIINNKHLLNIRLVVVGGKGWNMKSIEHLASIYRISDKVDIHNFVPDHALSSLYKNAYFLAMPSLYEGFGLPLVEAMKYGIPALTSLTSSMPEVAGNAAVYINPKCVKSIVHGLEIMIFNKKLFRKLKKNALRRAKLFRWDITSQKTFNILIKSI